MGGSEDDIPDLVALTLQPTPLETTTQPPTQPSGSENGTELPPVPVTLITGVFGGYLGSGKSTLVRYILTEPHGFRIAVIVNEYGDSSGIEQSIIEAPDGKRTVATEWLELANGCLCCSVKSDFVSALETLLGEKRDRFDYVLVETTGLANPGPVATSLWTDSELDSAICLDSIITVVDAKHIIRQLDLHHPHAHDVNEAQQQLAYADLILLNKTDLVDEETLEEIEKVIRSVNASAEVIRTHRSRLEVVKLLNRHAYTPEAVSQLTPTSNHPSHPHAHEGHSHEDCSDADCEGHSPQVGTVALDLNTPLDASKFEKWVNALLWGEGSRAKDVFRMKGLLNFKGRTTKHVLQAVHELYEITEAAEWSPLEKRHSKIVLIGRHLHQETLALSFEQCKADV